MQSLKLRNFKGLFTNIDESDADHEYMRVCQDVKIRPGQMSSQNYKFEEIEGLVGDGEEILHFETVYIDNDKNANKEVENKLVSAYKRDLKPYYLLITYKNETFVKLFDIGTKQLLFASPSKNYSKFNKIKIVNNEGIVKIIANNTVYLLSRINRIRYPDTTAKTYIPIKLISQNNDIGGYPVKITTEVNHQLQTGDMIRISNWEGSYKITEQVYELASISTGEYPAVCTVIQSHRLVTGDKVTISDWEGSMDWKTPYQNLNREWTVTVLDSTRFTIPTRIESTITVGTATYKYPNYNGPIPKDLNNEWIVTVLDSKSFTVNNWITDTEVNGQFEVTHSLGMIYNSGFLFEELLPEPNNNFISSDVKLVTSGDLYAESVKIVDGGYVSFGVGKNDKFPSQKLTFYIKDIDGDIPFNMSVFQALSARHHISSGVKSGEWLFPFLHAPKTYYGFPTDSDYLVCPADFFELYFDFEERHNPTAMQYWKVIDGPRIRHPYYGDTGIRVNGQRYAVEKGYFDSILYKWSNKNSQTVALTGFEKTASIKVEVIGTLIYDYLDEVIDSTYLINIPNEIVKYGISVSNIDFSNLPLRVTAVAFYFRNNPKSDFEQVAYFDLCSRAIKYPVKDKKYKFFVSTSTPNGIYLNQTIGVMYDTNRYKLIRSVQDYKVISGIPFIISDGNLVTGAIGSGNAMNIFYEQNMVPDVSDLNLTQIVDVNGTLGAADESSLNLINFTNTDGVLLFSKKDSLSYGISNVNHIAELPEGIVIYTKQGIYITNGYDKKLISEQINNIVEDNYDAGYIVYDSYNEELYFSDGRRLFKYSSQYNYWIQIGLAPGGILRVDNNGELIFFSKDSREDKEIEYKCYRMVEGTGRGIIRTMKMDLGDPTILKSLRNIVFDFKGTIWIEGKKLESAERSMIVKSLHVGNPNSVRFVVEWQFTGIIYGVTLNYDLQGEARLKTYSNI